MKRNIFIILFFSLNQIYGQQMELISGHVLFRHGDRTPISTFPSDPIKEKDWPNGFGQLTSAGIEQQYRLGKYLRQRYGYILNVNYTAGEIYVRSTDYDRTLMSAQANLAGLYSINNISNYEIPIQPVPIHTVPMKEDFLLGINDCPKYDEIGQQVYLTDEFRNMNKYYEPFFKKLQPWTNMADINLQNSGSIADTIFVEHIYNRTPAWADEGVQKNLSDISDNLVHFLYLNNDTRRIRGGPLVQDIWMNMNSSSHGEAYHKVKIYSAHDTTVSAVLAFLGINYPHQPAYASALFIDLYKQNSTYFVKVEYLNVTDSNKAYPYRLDGCSEMECPLATFTSIYSIRFPSSVEIECAKAPAPIPPHDGNNKKMIILLSIIVIGLGSLIIAAFIWIYLRKKERGAPLLSTESFSQIA